MVINIIKKINSIVIKFQQVRIIAGISFSFVISLIILIAQDEISCQRKKSIKMPIKLVLTIKKPLTLKAGKAKMKSGRTHYCTYLYLFKENL